MGNASEKAMGVEWFGMLMGLAFVLSFGYWCTDFLVVQRAMAADSMTAARRTPVIAAFPKMAFPFLVILPGMIAGVATSPNLHGAGAQENAVAGSATQSSFFTGGKGIIPPKYDAAGKPVTADGKVVLDYDLATPMMLVRYFPSGLLGLGLCALIASFMSGMAGETTPLNTGWADDIYPCYIEKTARQQNHLLDGGADAGVWFALFLVM